MENIVMQINNMVFSGNIINNGWIENLKYDNGKTNMNAVFLLSELVANCIENNSFIIAKDINGAESKFGLTKRQIEEAFKYLKNKNIINSIENSYDEIIAKLKNKYKNADLSLIGIGEKICCVCGIKTHVLHYHHYPIKKCNGGIDTIGICPNCHNEFHYMENYLILNLSKLNSISSHLENNNMEN